MPRFLLFTVIAALIIRVSGGFPRHQSRLFVGVAVSLLVLLAVGQARSDHALYPFDNWGLYASAVPPRNLAVFMVRDVTGSSYHYPFVQVTFSSPRAFMSRAAQVVSACRCDKGDEHVDAFLEALVGIHERASGRRVAELVIYDVDLSQGTRGAPIQRVKYRWQRLRRGLDR